MALMTGASMNAVGGGMRPDTDKRQLLDHVEESLKVTCADTKSAGFVVASAGRVEAAGRRTRQGAGFRGDWALLMPSHAPVHLLRHPSAP